MNASTKNEKEMKYIKKCPVNLPTSSTRLGTPHSPTRLPLGGFSRNLVFGVVYGLPWPKAPRRAGIDRPLVRLGQRLPGLHLRFHILLRTPRRLFRRPLRRNGGRLVFSVGGSRIVDRLRFDLPLRTPCRLLWRGLRGRLRCLLR